MTLGTNLVQYVWPIFIKLPKKRSDAETEFQEVHLGFYSIWHRLLLILASSLATHQTVVSTN